MASLVSLLTGSTGIHTHEAQSFYVRVYWQCRRRGIRKSNKSDVLRVMRLVDNCDISDTTKNMR